MREHCLTSPRICGLLPILFKRYHHFQLVLTIQLKTLLPLLLCHASYHNFILVSKFIY